jgi:hypothetical protein
MKTLSVIAYSFFCFTLIAQAQTITCNNDSASFGVAYENAPDSLTITLNNPLNESITIKKVHFYNTYSRPAFYTKDTNFVILPNSNKTIQLYFAPYHNIFHQSVVVFETNKNGSLALYLTGQGKFSNTYYNSTENLTEEALRTALKNRITQGYSSLGYNTARNKMFEEIDNKKVNGQNATINTVECIYTTTLCTGFANRTAAQTNCSFDTEHTYPQSLFNQNEPMRSDLFHIFPTKSAANNSRGNLAFGVATAPFQEVTDNTPSKKGSNNVYEPHDGQKGVTARAMMYFVVRYQDYNNYFAPQEAILRTWHHQFLPTSIEKNRNQAIFVAQGNRNPFIDYPQFAERITKLVGTSTTPSVFALHLPQDSIFMNQVPQNTDVFYRFVVVNHGNQPIQINNAAINHSDFELVNGNNATILPQSFHTFVIKLNTQTTALQALLSFNTNVISQSVVQVPINVSSIVSSLKPFQPRFEGAIYPQPAADYLTIENQNWTGKSIHYEISNTLGQTLLKQSTSFSGTEKINTQALQSGYYWLHIYDEQQRYTQRFIIQK